VRPRKRSKALWLVPAGVVLLVGLLGLGWALLPQLVWRTVQREAEQRGVSLETCQLALGWSALRLTRCEFRLSTFPEVTGTLERVDVTLERLKPKSIAVSGAHVAIDGLPRFQDLAYRLRPTMGDAVPFVLRESDLSWKLTPEATPWLALSEIAYSTASGTMAAHAVALDRFRGTLTGSAEALALNLLSPASPGSDLSFRTEQARDALELVLEFHQLPLGQLEGSALDWPPALETVRADGRVHVRIPVGLTAETPSGDLRAVLSGLNFPVPRELDGLVYGTPAELIASLNIARNLEKSELERVSFVAGALSMRGRGRVELGTPSGLDFQLSLSGELQCSAIARSASAAHKGSELAQIGGRIAQKSLKGTVQINSALSGNSRVLDQAQVSTTVGVGCGIKPLPLEELLKAPLELLQQLPKNAPQMPLPTFQFPKLSAPRSKATSRLEQAPASEGDATGAPRAPAPP
jgi:hypothetical protein